MKTLIIFSLIFLMVKSWDCPFRCFCYKWKNMMRTDCVKKNLYNTFVKFSHETEVLDLSHNVISILHGNEFLDANANQLKFLILSNNRIYQIDKLSFNGLLYLEFVDLSYNNIQFLDPSTFEYNTNFKTLNLSYNPLRIKMGQPILYKAFSLMELNFAGCKLKNLSFEIFQNLENLHILNISDNHIQKIDLESLKPLINLRYLDVSRNDLICDNDIASLINWLWSQRIQFSPFCQTSQKMIAEVVLPEINKVKKSDIDDFDNWTTTPSTTTTNEYVESSTFTENVFQYLQSIPFYYSILFGIQFGIFLGSLLTCLCLRKPKKNLPSKTYFNSQGRYVNNNPENSTFTLVPLRTPPGTPPSPYYSRLTLPSNYSLTR